MIIYKIYYFFAIIYTMWYNNYRFGKGGFTMATDKMKCTECGYVFEGDTEVKNNTCPLCSREYNTEKALEYYRKTNSKSNTNNHKKTSPYKRVLDWVIFGLSFVAFIVILYFIINYIVNG